LETERKNFSIIGRVDFVVSGKIVSTVSGGPASTESAYNAFTEDLSEGKTALKSDSTESESGELPTFRRARP
jgi:hypothetical protein